MGRLLVDDDNLRHEEGGYIYVDGATGEVSVRRTLPGQRRRIELSNPPLVPGCFLVATYHTHPNPASLGWDPEPSVEDLVGSAATGVPWFVVSELGVFVAGPDRRVGGLGGRPGYPL